MAFGVAHCARWAALVGALGIGLLGCGSAPDADRNTANGPACSGAECACIFPDTNCACDSPGKAIACGMVLGTSGEATLCQDGMRTCGADRKWGACMSDSLSPPTPTSASFATKALAPSAGPCVSNPCDPNCRTFGDAPGGFDAGRPVITTDAGLTLEEDKTPVEAAFTGMKVKPNPGLITVTEIPDTARPVTSPMPLKMLAELIPTTGAPVPTPALWSLDRYDSAVINALGEISVYVPIATTINVKGRIGSYSDTAPVKIVVDVKEVDAGLDATKFTGPSGAAENNTMLYPYEGTVFPRGITPPVIQWTPGTAADMVKVTLRYLNAGAGIDFTYSKVTTENFGRFQPARRVWLPFDATASGATAQLKVQRVVGGTLRAEKTINITFSTAPLRGTIYYWEINNGSVAKIDAESGVRTANWLKPAGGGRCVACHSVSADGSTIVVQHDGGNGPGGVYNAKTGIQTYDRGGVSVQWQALSPTGKYNIWNDQGYLSLTSNPAAITSLRWAGSPLLDAHYIVNPAFSPNGTKVAFSTRNWWDGWYVDYGISDLWVANFTDGGSYFSGFTKIVAGANNAATPSFNPNGSWIAYQTASALRTRNNTGALRYVKTDGSVNLAMTAAGGVVTSGHLVSNADTNVSYEPTLNPEASGGFDWMVFISNRSYGNIIGNCTSTAGGQKDCGVKQMWVSAVSQSPTAGTDPSKPAFWLPGQELTNQNMRGYWAKSACTPTGPDGPPAAPPEWRSQDIGSVGSAGSSTDDGTTVTIKASGDDIWNNADAFHYRYRRLVGDGGIIARVNSVSATDGWAKAGVMIRQGLDAPSQHAMTVVTPGNGVSFQRRYTSGGGSAHSTWWGPTAPYWVALVRAGDYFYSYVSPDPVGIGWYYMGYDVIAMSPTVYIGLATTAHNNSLVTTATFPKSSIQLWGAVSSIPDDPFTCTTNEDCCGWDPDPTKSTAACRIDLPITFPITRSCKKIAVGGCQPTGASCSIDSDCCNYASGSAPEKCIAGACAKYEPPPRYLEGKFVRIYDGACGPGTVPKWRFFDWKTITPGDSKIVFTAKTAIDNTPAALAAATSVTFGSAPPGNTTTWTGADVGAALTAAGIRSERFLEVTATLKPTTDFTAAPTLVEWRQNFSCVASE